MTNFAQNPGHTLADLSFVLDQLVAAGKTTVREIHRLIEHRGERIQQLRAELAVLLGGGATATTPVRKPAPAKTAKPKAAKPKVAKPKAAQPKPAQPKPAPKKKFTMTPKAAAARKVQGEYMGYLRNFKGKDRDAIKAIAKAKGVPAAVADMRKRLAK